jgi:hypothetical protein
MHNALLDDKGRIRATIFYKGAFYDRRAHIRVLRRFSIESRPVCGWENYAGNCAGKPEVNWVVVVLDSGSVVWTSEQIIKPTFCTKENFTEADALEGRRIAEAKNWLINKGYPDWENPAAYWD